MDLLNNRELSSLIWMLLLLTFFIIWSRDIRKFLAGCLGALFKPRLCIPILVSMVPVLVLMITLSLFPFWDSYLWKTFVIWVFIVGLQISFKAPTINRVESSLVSKTIKLVANIRAVLVFFLNYYIFSLALELVLFPVLALTTVLVTCAEVKDYHKLNIRLNWVLALMGFGILFHAVISTTYDHSLLLSSQSIKTLALPIVLTLTHIPFAYLLAVYCQYEGIFIRIGHCHPLLKGSRQIKLLCLRVGGLSVGRIYKLRIFLFTKMSKQPSIEAATGRIKKFGRTL